MSKKTTTRACEHCGRRVIAELWIAVKDCVCLHGVWRERYFYHCPYCDGLR